MTCKDCIHCGVCPTWNDDIPYVEGEYCGGFKKFKNKSDMQKVKQGYWEEVQDGAIRCSKCHCAPAVDIFDRWILTKFCPNCGAKMDGKDKIAKND